MIKVVKFGGSSLASAEQFAKVGKIIHADKERRYVVPSAPGKRNSNDTKVTDLLYKCYRAAEKGHTDFDKVLTEIKARYQEIIDGLGLGLSLEEDFNIIEEKFKNHAGEEYAASRGEYLNGKIMADYLGYEFVDSAKIIRFDGEGQFDMEMTNRLTREYLKDKESDCYLTSNLYVVSEVTKLQRGLDRIGSKYGFKTTFKDLRYMYKERCLKSCMDMNILMELLGVQSLKLNLPENYKSSNEEKKRQVNKL